MTLLQEFYYRMVNLSIVDENSGRTSLCASLSWSIVEEAVCSAIPDAYYAMKEKMRYIDDADDEAFKYFSRPGWALPV